MTEDRPDVIGGRRYYDATTGRGRLRGPHFDDDARVERLPYSDRPRHADGQPVPPLLDPGADVVRAARTGLPAGACEIAVGAADRVPRFAGPRRADGRVLRPPRGVAVVR